MKLASRAAVLVSFAALVALAGPTGGQSSNRVVGGTSILGGQGTYFGTIAGAVLLVTMTALITVVNASEGWRSVILGCLILAMLPLSGRDQSR